MSGVDLGGRRIRKGAGDAILALVESEGGQAPPELRREIDGIAREGGTPLAVARDNQVLGVVYLKDVVKEGMAERFDQLRAMGIRTVMVTGDNPLTAEKIAGESGVDDFLAQATPERKLELIREEQADGRLVAMTGDGTNDAPALAQADVGVAMNTGTQAAREAGNMVDLDSNPTKLIEIVEIGKQLLITRGALTTFSVANDIAKYFAILPAIFAATYVAAGADGSGPLDKLNVMDLGTPRVGDHLGDRLQRADHPAARAARAPRRPLPGGRRDRAAAPQHADLRLRRDHRAVRRDQADRPARPQRLRRLSAKITAMARSGRGHYKIFLGMAAGVGKTYRMLQEGQAEARAGRDVVIAYLEPHGRAETDAQAEGLERLPRRKVDYRGAELEEMDLPAVFQRAPELALVDELAHTNAPGLEHHKRYEDIEDILEAGIDVYSTVNIQHLESLNDRVAELTGVRVRETFPDTVLKAADEVVLIDLTPEALIDRLQAGKIYPSARVGASLNNFFRIENLATLRELALRLTAEEVEAKARPRRDDEPLGTRGAREPIRAAGGRRAGAGPGHPAERARCGWCAVRGARPSGSAPSWICCTSPRPAPSRAPRSESSSERSAGWRPSSGLGSESRRATTSPASPPRLPPSSGRPTS